MCVARHSISLWKWDDEELFVICFVELGMLLDAACPIGVCSVSSVGRAFGCYHATPCIMMYEASECCSPKGRRFEPVIERMYCCSTHRTGLRLTCDSEYCCDRGRCMTYDTECLPWISGSIEVVNYTVHLYLIASSILSCPSALWVLQWITLPQKSRGIAQKSPEISRYGLIIRMVRSHTVWFFHFCSYLSVLCVDFRTKRGGRVIASISLK